MGFKEATISLMLIVLFSFVIINFGISFANNNDAAISISDNEDLNNMQSNYRTDSGTYSVSINGSSQSYEESTIEEGSESLITGSQFKPGILVEFFNTFKVIFNVIHKNIFGGSQVFGVIFTTLITTLVLILVYYSYKAWKGGNPE